MITSYFVRSLRTDAQALRSRYNKISSMWQAKRSCWLLLLLAATAAWSVPAASQDIAAAIPACAVNLSTPCYQAVSKGVTWNYVLTGTKLWTPNTWKPSLTANGQAVKAYFVDLFDTSTAMVQYLKANGSYPVCYFSAGTRELGRPDVTGVPAACIGNVLPDWPDENYWNISCQAVKDILTKRIQSCFDKGFVGIDPDNVDVTRLGRNTTGFNFTRQDAINFITWLADAAHKKGMGMGLKNVKELIPWVKDKVDWAVNEECFSDAGPCDKYQQMKNISKAVYQVEYLLPTTDCDWCVWSYDAWNKTVCPNATTYGLTPILKQLDLEQAPYYTCK